MPFTYSVANGIGAGMVMYTVLQVATGKARQVPVLLWLVSGAFVVYFGIDPVTTLLKWVAG